MKKNLIALVATALMVGSERVVIEPGQPLPDVSDKDAKDLLEAKAARARIDESGVAATEATADSPDANPVAVEPDAGLAQTELSHSDNSKPRAPQKKTATKP